MASTTSVAVRGHYTLDAVTSLALSSPRLVWQGSVRLSLALAKSASGSAADSFTKVDYSKQLHFHVVSLTYACAHMITRSHAISMCVTMTDEGEHGNIKN